jgi:hypothetical protein
LKTIFAPAPFKIQNPSTARNTTFRSRNFSVPVTVF